VISTKKPGNTSLHSTITISIATFKPNKSPAQHFFNMEVLYPNRYNKSYQRVHVSKLKKYPK